METRNIVKKTLRGSPTVAPAKNKGFEKISQSLVFFGCGGRFWIKGASNWQKDGLYLPDSKTGAKKVYLGQAAKDFLKTIVPKADNSYVIYGNVKGQHLMDLQKPWRKIREKADLDGLRIHDLRHSFASFGLAGGLTLAEIGKLLGHTQQQTTARYAHLAEKYAVNAADKISGNITSITNGGG